MSGFTFYLVCRACGLVGSPSYPEDGWESVVQPAYAVLPAVDRVARTFGQVQVAVAGLPLTRDTLVSLARQASSATRTVCVRGGVGGARSLEPRCACPACDEDAVEIVSGNPPRRRRVVATIDELVRESRRIRDGEVRAWEWNDRGVQVDANGCEDARGIAVHWKIRMADSVRVGSGRRDVDEVTAELMTALEAQGCACSPRRSYRGFTSFIEAPRSPEDDDTAVEPPQPPERTE